MSNAERALPMPSSWPPAELHAAGWRDCLGRLPSTRAQLATLRDSRPPSRAWGIAAELLEHHEPELRLRDEDGSEPAKVGPREKHATVRRRGRAVRS